MVALGDRAFVTEGQPLTVAGQLDLAGRVLDAVLEALGEDAELVLTYGNGPQVTHTLTRVERALGEAYAVPLEVAVAETEGELGYVLSQALHNVLAARGRRRPVAGLLTQVLVDAGDPELRRPSKPVGPHYDPGAAAALESRGFVVRDDDGRGLRRLVPSPEPLELLDLDVVERMLDAGVVVVAAGGGGIPVVECGGRLQGVEAVIDKDLAAGLLASCVHADRFLILTGVPCAYRGFGTRQALPIPELTTSQARALLAEGCFEADTMAPKIEAAARFAEATGRPAIVTDPASLAAALDGRAGTTVRVDEADWC